LDDAPPDGLSLPIIFSEKTPSRTPSRRVEIGNIGLFTPKPGQGDQPMFPAAKILCAVTLCGILTLTSSVTAAVKTPSAHKREQHVNGIVEAVHHAKGGHGQLTIKVQGHHGRAGGATHHGKDETFTFGPDTKIEVDGKQMAHHHGLGALKHGEHVTVLAHGHHADVVIIHHHHHKK
jgi:hypothetical protein